MGPKEDWYLKNKIRVEKKVTKRLGTFNDKQKSRMPKNTDALYILFVLKVFFPFIVRHFIRQTQVILLSFSH